MKDTGVGIEEDNIKELLQEFPTIKNVDNDFLKGVGLGLLISNKIANLLNKLEGGIEVTSKIDKGSVFSFKIYDLTQRRDVAIDIASAHFNSKGDEKTIFECK